MNPENNQEPDKIYKTKFSWLRIGKIVLIVVIAAAVVGGIWLLVTSRPVKIAWASLINNRRENYLACEQLPFFPQVQKAFDQHQDVVNKVKAVPGIVDFKPELLKCVIFTGGTQFLKGDGVLEYKNRSARSAAEKIIGKDFYSMPYSGQPTK